MSTDKESQVRSFLLSVKTTMQGSNKTNPKWTFTTVRRKNMDTLVALEMNVDEVKEVILSLTPTDYCSGPLRDKNIAGDLWEFGKTVKGKDIYIKLKLSGDRRSRMVRILSFHFPDRPLQYHFVEKVRKEIRVQ